MEIMVRGTVEIGDLPLASGRVLPECQLAYESWGRPNASRDNTVLVVPSFTKDKHVASTEHDRRVGWWQTMVGDGLSIDTRRWFVIAFDLLGTGESTSPLSADPRNSGQHPYGSDFPTLSTYDIAMAQVRGLLELGISSAHAVIGGCSGGQAALELAVAAPGALNRLILISTSPRVSAHTVLLGRMFKRMIEADPEWQGGDFDADRFPARGLANALWAGLPVWMSRDAAEARFAHGGVVNVAAIDELLTNVATRAATRHRVASSLPILIEAFGRFNLAEGYGSLEAAAARITAPVHLVSYTTDPRYTPADSRLIEQAVVGTGGSADHVVLDSSLGHGAFMYDSAGVGGCLRTWLGEGPDGRTDQ